MNDALIRFGKRVHELRTAKNWSQEEFAHVSGLHRTYIGQIERGEKNISFGNLLKISGVFGLTLSEMFSGLENGVPGKESRSRSESGSPKTTNVDHRMFEIQKLVTRLGVQRAAMNQTITILEELAGGTAGSSKSVPGRKTKTK